MSLHVGAIGLAVALWAPSFASTGWAQGSTALVGPLRLEQVMQLARERRTEIRAARARARAADQRPALVSALDDPMVFPAIDHLPFRLHGVNTSVTVEQRFPLSGLLGSKRRAAEAESHRLHAEIDRVALDVELEAGNAFLMLHERREAARILDEQRIFAAQFVRAALARFSAGTGGQADAMRAEIEVARLDGAARAISAEVRAAEAMLNTTLARPTEAPIPALETPIATAIPAAPETVRKAALEQRPELRAGRAEISRAQEEISIMRSMSSPMGMVRTGPAYTMADGPGWMVMLGISLPIWRGRVKAGVAEAEAMVEMSKAEFQAMQRMVEGEAATARQLVIASRERVLSLRDEVIPRARQAITPTLAEYSAGQLPLVSVIEAAQALWSAQGDLVSAEFSLGVAQIRLRRATAEGGARP